ncbi:MULTISPECIES: glycosyltransferase family 4 protein [Pedobacter]|uniref:Glycosyltransferase family 4 protein n=1 Tax=Pedobacter agri TaxID=454586 RepID=A0A9X3DB28_9SPHI|nr:MULTISPECIES: glycosyltransferase [Pedobacter]AZI25213.1 glycosyltransferase [Pedobacter sp. G11]MCX3264022.1 glycosyltransferase family 4 protein [Pedobacter agri]
MLVTESKKLNVLFILHLPPPIHGASIANTYIKESKIINSEHNTDYISLATNTVLSQTGKGSIRKAFKFLSILGKILKLISTKNYDLCYLSLTASGPAFYKDLIVVALLKLANKKILYHFHNKGVALAKQNKVNDALYRFAFKGTKSILLSKYLYSDIQRFVKETDVFYCPYGIPVSTVCTQKKPKEKSSINAISLLYLSNMMIEKGVYDLLHACVLLKNRNIPFVCNFVGGWTDITPEEFDKFVEENDLSMQVFAHGPKYATEKLNFFNHADVFIFPTFYHYETFGLVNLEAMQHSLPIISTHEGGIPDVISDGNTGFLVPKNTPEAIAEKIVFFAEHPEHAEAMGLKGKLRFEEYFTIDKFEQNISQVIGFAAKQSFQI